MFRYIYNFFSNINWEITISLFSLLISVITVVYMVRGWKEQEQLSKPYFIIEQPGIKQLPNSDYRTQITFYNKGKRPAMSFMGSIYLIDQTLEKDPYQEIIFSIGNDIPVDSPTPWYSDGLKLSQNMNPVFIVTKIKYKDSITNYDYTQFFFMKWDGVVNGSTSPDFTHMTIEERNKVQKKIEDYSN